MYATTGPFVGDASFDRGSAYQIWPNEIYPYVKSTQVFDCPSRDRRITGSGAPYLAYSVNAYLSWPTATATSQWCTSAVGGSTTCPMNASLWAQPSMTFMVMEPSWTGYTYLYSFAGGTGTANGRWTIPAVSNGPWQAAFDAQFGPSGGWNVLPANFDVGRHLGGTNICYADGHVKWTNNVSDFVQTTTGWQSHWKASGT
jgi:prepilin-type processing-associated H-X9-DG protein